MGRRATRALVAACSLMLTGCSGWQSALDVHGESAITLKQLIVLIVAVCSIVWALVMIALIFALARRRTRREPPLQVDAVTERRMTVTVSAAVAATVLIITAFTVLSFFTTRALSVAGADDLTIKVRGLQWWWGVEYFGATPDQRFETANEIHIPVGRKVRLQLEGLDVIHSFWVPSLAGKQDLVVPSTNGCACSGRAPSRLPTRRRMPGSRRSCRGNARPATPCAARPPTARPVRTSPMSAAALPSRPVCCRPRAVRSRHGSPIRRP
jgi:heme/copper-type cytochrome/quinol oxidase subunit 2